MQRSWCCWISRMRTQQQTCGCALMQLSSRQPARRRRRQRTRRQKSQLRGRRPPYLSSWQTRGQGRWSPLAHQRRGNGGPQLRQPQLHKTAAVGADRQL